MAEHAVRLARGIGWYGMCDFDWIYDVRDHRPKLMEINPRVTDTIQLAQYAGIDFFRLMDDMSQGRKPEPRTKYRTGLYMRFLPGEILWFLTTKGPRLGLTPSFFRFFGSDTRYLVTSLSDPGPTIGYILDGLSAMLDPRQREFLLRTGGRRKQAHGR
jgi:predicted ATP-grasp superfamily ATP-dependent carboligase